MSSDVIQQLVILSHQLHQQGHQPSVGLLRSKAPMKVSVTQAIDAIKRFNASDKAPAPASTVASDAVTIAALQKRVDTLEAAVAVLERRLNKLTQVSGD